MLRAAVAKADPNELPMLRERTVSPKHSPNTRSMRKPGKSFIVLTMTLFEGSWPPL